MSIPLSTPVDRVHFHPSISHCIFMCIVGSENMLLFSNTKRQGKFSISCFHYFIHEAQYKFWTVVA